MSPDEVLQEEPIAQQSCHQGGLGQDAGLVEPGLVGQGGAQDVQTADEVGRPEVVEAGLVDGRGHQGIGAQGDIRPGLGHHVQDGPCLVGEPRLGQVVEGDGRWPGVRAHRKDSTGTNSTSGCSGVSSGRNQRNQMRPRWWPAVDTQLGWPGSVGEMTITHEPSAS